MQAVGNYVICKLDRPDEVKTASGLYLDTKKESDVYRVVSSGVPEIPDNSRIAIDDNKKQLRINGEDYFMVHKEFIFAII